jgi:hypothetical protein
MRLSSGIVLALLHAASVPSFVFGNRLHHKHKKSSSADSSSADSSSSGEIAQSPEEEIAQCMMQQDSMDYITKLIGLEGKRTSTPSWYVPAEVSKFARAAALPVAANANISHIINIPDYIESFEWLANVIPSEFNENNAESIVGLPPPFDPSLGPPSAVNPLGPFGRQMPPFFNIQTGISQLGHKKFPGFAFWMLAFNNLDPDTWQSSDARNTIFVTNLEDRGPNNRLKKRYMNALTCDKMEFYEAKIDKAVNGLYEDITKDAKPISSMWEARVFDLYLDLHLGEADHPSFIRDHIREVSSLLSNNIDGSAGNLNDELNKVACANKLVTEYYEERRQVIVSEKDKSTFVYWWNETGIPAESLVFEAAHNIVAFGQLVNILFLVIRTKLQGYRTFANVALGATLAPPLDFFEKFDEASNDYERLDVAREAYRLLMPSNIWVSSTEKTAGANANKKISDEDFDMTKTFQLPFLIQAMNDNFNQTDYSTRTGKMSVDWSVISSHVWLSYLLRCFLLYGLVLTHSTPLLRLPSSRVPVSVLQANTIQAAIKTFRPRPLVLS